ncbi:MAG: tetratricopeptide repeat protein [Clostridia bacterium]|nr:tetratricopeptide repeat protein [Clostridia bacterium]
MKKRKIIALIALCILVLSAFIIAIVEVSNKGSLGENSVKSLIALLVSALILTVKLISSFKKEKNSAFSVYEKEYKDIIDGSFSKDDFKKERLSLLEGIDLFNNKEYEKAIELLTSLKEKCVTAQDKYGVYFFIAKCYSRMGNSKSAIEIYSEATEFYPISSTLWSNLGFEYDRLGDFEKAKSAYKKAIDVDNTNSYALSNMAQLLLKAGDYDGCITYAKRALDYDSSFYQASNALALAYIGSGDEGECLKYYNLSISLGVDKTELQEAIKRFNGGKSIFIEEK